MSADLRAFLTVLEQAGEIAELQRAILRAIMAGEIR